MCADKGPLEPEEAIRIALSIHEGLFDPLVKRLYGILEARESGKILRYILDHRVFTVLILQHELMLSPSIVYKTLKDLQVLGFVIELDDTIKGSGKGRPDKMYSMGGVSPSEVVAVRRFHLELKFRSKSDMGVNLRQLVFPIVDEVIEDIQVRTGGATLKLLPQNEVRKRFNDRHGCLPDGLNKVIAQAAVDHGLIIHIG